MQILWKHRVCLFSLLRFFDVIIDNPFFDVVKDFRYCQVFTGVTKPLVQKVNVLFLCLFLFLSACFLSVNKINQILPRYYLSDLSLKEVGGSQGRIPGQILIMHFSNLIWLIEWRNIYFATFKNILSYLLTKGVSIISVRILKM